MMTIGHSNRTLADFVALLQAHAVDLLVDVRTVPRSRHNPQFNLEELPESLAEAGIAHRHMPELGGLRHPRKDSQNTGWDNLSFRGYADYMQTPEFAAALESLVALESGQRVAIMCAEAVPWRCHRSLITDALTARNIEVRHILSAAPPALHKLTKFAHIEGVAVTYPPGGAHPGFPHSPIN